jgi:hypothetical protein
MTGRNGAPPDRVAGHLPLWVFLPVAVALVYSWILAGTTPFTSAANVLTALPIAVGAVAAVVVVRRRSAGRTATIAADRRPGTTRGWWVWLVLIGLIVAWELVMLFGMPRSSHPTLSSVLESIARWHSTKALLVAAWLALGAFLVTR